MKYVIELPEYIKHEVDIEEDVDKAEDFIKWYSATLTCAIKDATPLQAELEEIKAEIIKGKCKYCDIDANIQKCLEEHNSICDVNDFLVILDNHISELKGE